jgi:pimeloyl-ACP methyl ester carboxylesterase
MILRFKTAGLVAALMMSACAPAIANDLPKPGSAMTAPSPVHYNRVKVGEVDFFYREAGPRDAPVVLLLHGFPTSGHMFRDLIPILSDKYHVIAPDLPGFGFTTAPERGKFAYTFDNLAVETDKFTQALGLSKYAIYVFDYGAPVGYRLAAAHPERITAIISQNGNAYEEGLSEPGWAEVKRYWNDPSEKNRNAIRAFFTPELTWFQYSDGVPDKSLIAPDGPAIDNALLQRPGNAEIQLDLFGDYKSNVAMYPAFHEYFRKHQPPLLAVWGSHDPFFLPPGAEAYKRDLPKAEVEFYDTGHFALETHVNEIGARIHDFLDRNVK